MSFDRPIHPSKENVRASAASAQRNRLINRALALHFMLQLSLAGDADARLKRRGLGRVHHRVLYFSHFAPGITVTELLSALDVQHQNIQRVLRQLVEHGYVIARQHPNDGRIRQLYSSRKGEKLLEFVGTDQRERINHAYDQVTFRDVKSYFKVMGAMLDPDRRKWADRLSSLDNPTAAG